MKFRYEEWGLILTALTAYAGELNKSKARGADEDAVNALVDELQKIKVKIMTSNLG
mgnify:CR=1 FL=1